MTDKEIERDRAEWLGVGRFLEPGHALVQDEFGNRYALITDAKPYTHGTKFGYTADAVMLADDVRCGGAYVYNVRWNDGNWKKPEIRFTERWVGLDDIAEPVYQHAYPKIRMAMYYYGLSSKTLAALLGITHRAVNLKLAGKRRWTGREAVAVLAALEYDYLIYQDFF